MNCILNNNEQEELLLGYVSAKLDPETARTYSRHLASCEHCRTMVEMQKILDESLGDWVPPTLSENFDQKLFARIRAEEEAPRPWWQTFTNFNFGWKAAVPLALAALLTVVLLVRDPGQSELAQQQDGIKADEIEQVEKALDDMEALQALSTADTVPAAKESI
jgi:anti-sigma factor RsiW